MKRLGAVQKNSVWSWCAVNEEAKSVYLSLWTDYRDKRPGDEQDSYLLQAPDWGVGEDGTFTPARADHDEKLTKVMDEDYTAFGYCVEAKDPTADPREIASTKTSFVFRLDVKRMPDGEVIGYPVERIEVR
jgi:hypothetical protein